jgi:hypothetical protein
MILLSLLLFSPALFGQEESPGEAEENGETPVGDSRGGSGLSFGLDLGIGVQTFEDPDNGGTDTYQSLSLLPEFSYGKFGLGFDLTLNYSFTAGSDGDELGLREEDWVPQDGVNFLELYLPKFRYIRYGLKGDPFYALLGSYSDARLGNGFLVSDYSNELFLPERRQFGFQLDFDGAGVSFPYLGLESFVSNVASFDLFGTRLFARPLAELQLPLLTQLQLGGTVVIDTNPAYHAEKDPDSPYFDGGEPAPSTGLPVVEDDDNVLAYGFDLTQPILRRDLLSLDGFGDLALQNEAIGGMVGVGGRAVRVLDYNAQVRILGDNFIPGYFDSTYDLTRLQRYTVYEAESTLIEGYVGWYGRLGLNIFQELLLLQLTMSGPFTSDTDVYPELEGVVRINEGLVPFFSFEAFYRKLVIREPNDIFEPEESIIGARLSYRSSPVVVSLTYNLTYDPYDPEDPWKVTSGLQSTISLN